MKNRNEVTKKIIKREVSIMNMPYDIHYNKERDISIKTKFIQNEFKFRFNLSDTMFILTPKNKLFKGRDNEVAIKMVIIKESKDIDIVEVSKFLFPINICKLNIISINDNGEFDEINVFLTTKYSEVSYVDMRQETFVKVLSWKNLDFIDYNRHNLYILRSGKPIDVKNLFDGRKAEESFVNFRLGESGKPHLLSTSDFKLSCYLMAMFRQDFHLMDYLNAFDKINQDYLK